MTSCICSAHGLSCAKILSYRFSWECSRIGCWERYLGLTRYWRKLHNDKPYEFYSSPDITWVIKWRTGVVWTLVPDVWRKCGGPIFKDQNVCEEFLDIYTQETLCIWLGSIVQAMEWALKDSMINRWSGYHPVFIITSKLNENCIVHIIPTTCTYS